jgi:hypothetical protein
VYALSAHLVYYRNWRSAAQDKLPTSFPALMGIRKISESDPAKHRGGLVLLALPFSFIHSLRFTSMTTERIQGMCPYNSGFVRTITWHSNGEDTSSQIFR